MKFPKIKLIILALFVIIFTGCGVKINYEDLQMINIHESIEFQVIDGFGASAAWWAQDIGGWSDENRNRIVDLLFDRNKGIGLSIYRYNLGGGSGDIIEDKWRRSFTLEIEPGVFDINQDKNAIWVLKAAQVREGHIPEMNWMLF